MNIAYTTNTFSIYCAALLNDIQSEQKCINNKKWFKLAYTMLDVLHNLSESRAFDSVETTC